MGRCTCPELGTNPKCGLGTPGFVIGEKIVQGAPDLENLADLIAQARDSGGRKF